MSEIIVPELAESITEGTIATWFKKEGDSVEKGEAVLELETDKVNVEVVSEEDGVISEVKAEEGDTVEVGQAIAVVSAGGSAPKSDNDSKDESKETPKAEEKAEEKPATDVKEDDSHIVATPSARKLAREKGISLSDVNAADPRGLVRSHDVNNHVNAPQQESAKKDDKTESIKESSKQQAKDEKPVVREPMSRRRQTIANRLLDVSQSTAMLTTFNEIDMTNVMELRKRKKEQFMERNNGTKLGFMSFFTKAAVAALKKYPAVNAEIDGTDLVYKQFYDIAIAVSTDEGLLVPVIRDCDRKNFAEIEDDIIDVATRARDKKLKLDEMTNGSFTITNGGVFGSLMSTPIINGTQAAILGMHTIQQRPVAVDGKVEIRPMMYVALSYDHRIIDGAESVGFLKTIKELIENPEDLLLEG
ncbi:2-oxoglutarate dehydrogenase complex dihydrolipoyllysine-residue succinyltransferase [Nosocomiicoccus ampullae]|uniref:Dihydrolipoyllysine-residue succinyltransferase component of 2-oxoglutarate dehydrogenase complex n=1 Tax=Nosocomiicoccus ampullae TaxID=489910 RepID=A0A9Q2HFC8_9STAP|nr:2-oxoglutarate dehydrogenase complex dihydrolipoyllysine-residue succinyltransferase [Nosocomiicoccus ampullae]MBB5175377.1 2-oxoglutarate dehydrogenase E2 component (dihydrolipoamide succinyltransferase) [Nosocomiicoccus ampullae]QYA46254.1 2-oxoglutarate dehydrogenase complex dihydrolipoyllysine-residue succinyltransferase [Nosocomiicoccus ampullae]QYA47755.1 2-oxoglutarate dehydrogenase complex dihydrolipoyllysine-residue succinyltransferase [Nosocomiicoccus ampullae]